MGTTISADPVLSDVLLEAGTNELEVLVFVLGDLNCGVNVAKVREVIGAFECTYVPGAHPAVVGVFNPRGSVLPLIDLRRYFCLGPPPPDTKRNVIITEFNDQHMGFIVDRVERIYRLSWQAIGPLPPHIASSNTAATGTCHISDKDIAVMIDFEKIALDIHGINVAAAGSVGSTTALDRGAYRLLLAEDSPTMRGYIQQTLVASGYNQVTAAENGVEAWTVLERALANEIPPFDLVVSDIEMPQMDGLHLCRRLKEHDRLKHIPVVVFSSLVSDDNHKKLAQVGADASLTKPQLPRLVSILDNILAQRDARA